MKAQVQTSQITCPRWARIRAAAAARRDKYPRQHCPDRAAYCGLISTLDLAHQLRARSPQLYRETMKAALAWARSLNLICER